MSSISPCARYLMASCSSFGCSARGRPAAQQRRRRAPGAPVLTASAGRACAAQARAHRRRDLTAQSSDGDGRDRRRRAGGEGPARGPRTVARASTAERRVSARAGPRARRRSARRSGAGPRAGRDLYMGLPPPTSRRCISRSTNTRRCPPPLIFCTGLWPGSCATTPQLPGRRPLCIVFFYRG